MVHVAPHDGPMANEIMLSAEAAQIIGCTPAAVRAMERRGELEAARTPTGVRLFDRREVERVARERTRRKILIYDEIGKSFWNDKAVSASQFVSDLQGLPAAVRTLNVRVNSPGGSVFDAIAIANALRDERTSKGRTVKVRIDGLAVSAATIITSAGAPIEMVSNALLMIHEPRLVAIGTADEFRNHAKTLDMARDTIVATYRWVSPKSEEELVAMLKATTWM